MKIFGGNPILRGREAVALSSSLILSAITVVVIFSPVLFSPLGPIDDHEYLKYRFSNPTGDLLLGARQGLDRAWEEFTKEGRVRPVYQIGRTVTTSLIGDNAIIRYAFRLTIATGVVLTLSTSTIKRASDSDLPLFQQFLLGMTSTALSLTILPWSDIVGRLGPPDSLGILGLLLAFFAVVLTLRGPNRMPHRAVIALLFCGLIVSAGSRESYALHTAILAASLILFHSRLSLGRRTLSGLAFFCLYPITSVIALNMRSGTDFYGKERTLRSSVEAFSDFMSSDLFVRNSPVVALWWLLSNQSERRRIAYLSIIAFAMMAADYLQYSTAITVYGRYRFTSDLVFLIALLGICVASLRLITAFRRLPAKRWANQLLPTAATAVFIFLWLPQLQETRSEFEYASRLNRGYAMTIGNLLEEIEASSSDSVVVFTDSMSETYRVRDLQERSVGLYWSIRSSLQPSTNVIKIDLASPPATYRPSFCIFVGVTAAPEISDTWSCKSFSRVF